MFYAAERDLRKQKRRFSDSLPGKLILSPDMKVSLVKPGSSEVMEVRQISSVYPSFTQLSVEEIRSISQVGDEECDSPRFKKARVTAPNTSTQNFEPLSNPNVSADNIVRGRLSTWEDLLNRFPYMSDILRQQQDKLEKSRIPVEFVRPVEKPSIADTINTKLEVSKPLDPAISKPAFHVPENSTPPVDNGGGLLAGIDDLFGESKSRTKIKSKRR